MAGSNQFGTWTDADERAVEDLQDFEDPTVAAGARANLTAAEKAYAIEKGYIKAPYDDAILREARKKQAEEEAEGKDPYPKKQLTYGDASGQMPRAEYANSTSINYSAKKSTTANYLNFTGTVAGVDVSQYVTGISSRYPLNQVIETLSGHVIEYNDTPESPRILIKHTSGSGIDMRPDGTICVTSHGDGKVEVNHGGHKLVVTGDGQLHFSGDLTLNVGGDFNVNVGGSFNVQAKEETKTVNGPSRDLYFGNKYTSIVGSRQDFMTENHTSAALGYRDEFTKGDHKMVAEGGATMAMKGGISMSSEAQITQSSPDINIAAENISVFGASGNIGGENVIMHNYNMYTGHSIWAGETVNTKTVTATKTMNAISFHGDLFGTATRALDANKAATANTGPSSPGGYTQTSSSDASFDTTGQNDKATSAVMSEYLHKGGYGIQRVFVDKGDHLKGAYDKTRDTGGVTSRILTTSEVRAKLRDKGHRENPKFANYQVSSGMISTKHNNPVPSGVGLVVSPKDVVITGRTGTPGGTAPSSKVKPTINLKAPISVDPQYDPAGADQILTTTKLSKSISLSQFLYGKGDRGKLDPLLRLEERKQLVRNLIPQANLVQRVRDNQDLFKGYNLDIIEGVYVKEPQEILTEDGILDLRTQGRAVVYEVIGPNGIVDKQKTFDTAVWLAANIRYDKIILDYDELDPRGGGEDVNVQIIVIMPIVKEDFTADFKMETETLFNNISQGSDFLKLGEPGGYQKGEEDTKDNIPNDGTDEPAGEGEDSETQNPPDVRLTPEPENLTEIYETEREFREGLVNTFAGDIKNNGKSFLYNQKQYWFATDTDGTALISESYDQYKKDLDTLRGI